MVKESEAYRAKVRFVLLAGYTVMIIAVSFFLKG
jgi:hypothetical protein